MAEPTYPTVIHRYPTVDDFLTGNVMAGSPVEVTGQVRGRVRGDPSNNGVVYLVSAGNFVRLFATDDQILTNLRSNVGHSQPVSVQGTAIRASDGLYDIQVTGIEAIADGHAPHMTIGANRYERLAHVLKIIAGKGDIHSPDSQPSAEIEPILKEMPDLLNLKIIERLVVDVAMYQRRRIQHEAAELLKVSPRVLSYKLTHAKKTYKDKL